MASLDAHDAALLEQEEHDLDPPGPFPAAAAAEAAGASHSSETVTDPGAAGPSEATASSSDERTERTERMASIELIEKEMGEVSLENFEELLGEKLKKLSREELQSILQKLRAGQRSADEDDEEGLEVQEEDGGILCDAEGNPIMIEGLSANPLGGPGSDAVNRSGAGSGAGMAMGAAATPVGGGDYMWDCAFCGRGNVARHTACATCTAARGRQPKDFSEIGTRNTVGPASAIPGLPASGSCMKVKQCNTCLKMKGVRDFSSKQWSKRKYKCREPVLICLECQIASWKR